MSDKVRVRFAPSPTGPLHIGGVRTALFNYLFAKKHGGVFILRIEDTDQSRYVPGAEAYIVEALDWLNIPFEEGPGRAGDFGPYRQSERKAKYEKYANALIESGNAYYAFDTSDELAELRKEQESKGETFIYNWHNRQNLKNSLSLPEKDVENKLSSKEPFVIRFKSPQDKTLELVDIIRGDIQIDTNNLDDKVLFKSDGMPTYHLANIVDDHLMKITHVIRGEEWLPSLPLHKMLYRALGWKTPNFAHLPLIMKPTGKGKLSKRDGDKMGFPVFPLEWTAKDGSQSSGYREEGYLPEAIINFLALLGWNPGNEQEIFSLDELIAAFDLAKVNKAGAKFDPDKTKWFQQHYFQQLDDAVMAESFSELIKEKGIRTSLDLLAISKLLKERSSFISDLWDHGSFFFIEPKEYEAKASKKAFKENTGELLGAVVDILKESEDFSAAYISFKVKEWITEQGIGFGPVMMPLRLALVGEMKGPDVFEIASILRKEETIKRILRVISSLDQK